MNNKSANHLAATRCIQACRRGEGDSLRSKVSIRMRNKGDWSDFERGEQVCWSRRTAGLSISQNTDLLVFCRTSQPSLGFTENSFKKRKYPMSRADAGFRGEWTDGLDIIERMTKSIKIDFMS